MRVSLRFEILKRDRFTCRYCGRSAPDVDLHVDHVRPRAEGGTDDPGNLVAACEDCNLGKSARLLTDSPNVAKAAAESARRHAERLAALSSTADAEEDLIDRIEREWNGYFSPYGRSPPPERRYIRQIIRSCPLHLAIDAVAKTHFKLVRERGMSDERLYRYWYGTARRMTQQEKDHEARLANGADS